MFDESKNPPQNGPIDHFIRRFRTAAHLVTLLALYSVAIGALGLALAPALYIAARLWDWSLSLNPWLHWLVAGCTMALSFFIAGFMLLVLVPLFNLILPTRIKSFKGGYYTVATLPWYLHNGLFYLVRYTFLPFVTLTPFGLWFLRAMGMRMGKRVVVNTIYISDPQLITLDDDVAIGGSVHIFAHYGGGGHLVIAPVHIGKGATIGLMATVMGDVQIGEGAVILAHSVLLPGSRVGAGETWGGVPARHISREVMDAYKESIHGKVYFSGSV